MRKNKLKPSYRINELIGKISSDPEWQERAINAIIIYLDELFEISYKIRQTGYPDICGAEEAAKIILDAGYSLRPPIEEMGKEVEKLAGILRDRDEETHAVYYHTLSEEYKESYRRMAKILIELGYSRRFPKDWAEIEKEFDLFVGKELEDLPLYHGNKIKEFIRSHLQLKMVKTEDIE